MQTRKLAFLTALLLSAAMLWGCGSSGSGGTDVTPPSIDDVARVSDTSCLVCHNDDAHTTDFNDFNHLVGILADGASAIMINHSCQDCHGGGSAHRGIGPIPHPRPDLNRCATCHGEEIEKFLGSKHNREDVTNVNMIQDRGTGGPCQRCHTVEGYVNSLDGFTVPIPGILHTVTCAACHDPLLETVRENACASCHSDLTVAAAGTHLRNNPFSNLISERFVDSAHADVGVRGGTCGACHSHEGAIVYLNAVAEAGSRDLMLRGGVLGLADDLAEVSSSSALSCATCHDPHSGDLRGLGDVLEVIPGGQSTDTGPAERVVYSKEFNLCTACHQVNLTHAWEPDVGYRDGGMFVYELAPAHSAESYDPNAVDFHSVSQVNLGRTIVDTHFFGEARLLNTGDSQEIAGYNINPGSKNACTACHDPHSANKFVADMLTANAVARGATIESYSETIGATHGNYLSTAFSRERSTCTPCHQGREFPKLTKANDFEQGMAAIGTARWNPLGCVSCHDMAIDAQDTEVSISDARTFVDTDDVTYEFAFGSEMVVNDSLDLNVAGLVAGKNQVCFECHKGRQSNGLVSHYKTAFATLVGAESGMYPLYHEEENYSRGTNDPDRHAGWNCTDCHRIHDPYGLDNPTNKANFRPISLQSDLCASCHYNLADGNNSIWRSFEALRERTRVFKSVLEDLIAVTPDGTSKTQAQNVISTLGTDKGAWAHNSLLARQLMFDAIVDLGGEEALCAFYDLEVPAQAAAANYRVDDELTFPDGIPVRIGTGTGNSDLMRGLTVGDVTRALPPVEECIIP